MTAARLNLISVEDYLASELATPVKHEYVAGSVYRMPEFRNQHSLVAGNTLCALHGPLRDSRFQALTSAAKIRLQLATGTRFYHPDASVIGEQNPGDDYFQDRPVVIAEVLSKSTRRIDENEKKDAYLTIPSLCVYLLVEQDMPALVVYRRTEQGFVREVYEGLDAVVPLPEIEIDLPLADLYEAVEFVPEVDEDA